jgi:cytochrome c-type biogenesis protein CcmH
LNLIFWLVAAIMILVALLILLPPLLRKQAVRPEADDYLDKRNIKIARDRLAELKANLTAGGISQSQYDEQVAELELALSDDLELKAPATHSQNQGRWLAYVLLVTIPVLSASLYWSLGDYQAISRVNDPKQVAQTAQADQANANMPSPEAINLMVTKLANKLKAQPNNLEGWVMLGRSYKVLQRYQEAADAFSRAYQLAGDKPEVMLPYAEVLAFNNNNDWGGKPMALVNKALSIEPENTTGLWFAAMAFAQQGDKKAAISYLRKLELVLPADSPDKQQIHDIIANSESKLAGKPTEKAVQQPAKSNGSIAVQVSLAGELQSGVKPEDTVFIYAQALSGPKMPLAIIRKQAKDLPLSVRLSDGNSMLPNMKLSNFKQVRLLARISKSGNPAPQSGDLLGVVEQVTLADPKENKVVINGRID